MSATTNVILAAGPTVVALAAIGSAVWQQKRGFSHERELSDLADVRAMLDDAAVALHEADYAYGDWISRGFSDTPTTEAIKHIGQTRMTIDRVVERLAVRLGPDDAAVQHLHAAKDALRAFEKEMLQDEPRAETVQSIRADVNDARQEFLAVASKTAGAKLP